MFHNIFIAMSTLVTFFMLVAIFVFKHGIDSKGNILQRIKTK